MGVITPVHVSGRGIFTHRLIINSGAFVIHDCITRVIPGTPWVIPVWVIQMCIVCIIRIIGSKPQSH